MSFREHRHHHLQAVTVTAMTVLTSEPFLMIGALCWVQPCGCADNSMRRWRARVTSPGTCLRVCDQGGGGVYVAVAWRRASPLIPILGAHFPIPPQNVSKPLFSRPPPPPLPTTIIGRAVSNPYTALPALCVICIYARIDVFPLAC